MRNEEIALTEVVSVKFKGRGKAYYFAPGAIQIHQGDPVVVETAKGLELGRCHRGNHFVADDRVVPPLRPVVRAATPEDLRVEAICRAREKEAYRIGQQKIASHGLDMKLVDVECNFEGNKIIFFFTADGRVDFRELVKDLAGVFRSRIELRQIGVRDEAKLLGGLGICGRPFCCSQFLDEFQPVSTKMAKVQNMSLNPTKISGTCGRLMCCLRYEQEAYEDLVKTAPKSNAFVETPDGYGNVLQLNLLRQQVKVRLDSESGDAVIKNYSTDEVATVPGGRPKPGEPLPRVLQLKPKAPPEPEEREDPWSRPVLFAAMEEEAVPVPEQRSEEVGGHGRPRRKKPKSPVGGPEGAGRGLGQQQPRQKPQQKPAGGGGERKKRPNRYQGKPQQNNPVSEVESKPRAAAQVVLGAEGEKKKSRRHWRPRNGKPKGEKAE